ncbi:MAG: hypothetical protein U9P14_04460 [Gemmatimonadota bacterium]|nr:hypothetical protein [Gemmatimonadota bacterium]
MPRKSVAPLIYGNEQFRRMHRRNVAYGKTIQDARRTKRIGLPQEMLGQRIDLLVYQLPPEPRASKLVKRVYV